MENWICFMERGWLTAPSGVGEWLLDRVKLIFVLDPSASELGVFPQAHRFVFPIGGKIFRIALGTLEVFTLMGGEKLLLFLQTKGRLALFVLGFRPAEEVNRAETSEVNFGAHRVRR